MHTRASRVRMQATKPHFANRYTSIMQCTVSNTDYLPFIPAHVDTSTKSSPIFRQGRNLPIERCSYFEYLRVTTARPSCYTEMVSYYTLTLIAFFIVCCQGATSPVGNNNRRGKLTSDPTIDTSNFPFVNQEALMEANVLDVAMAEEDDEEDPHPLRMKDWKIEARCSDPTTVGALLHFTHVGPYTSSCSTKFWHQTSV